MANAWQCELFISISGVSPLGFTVNGSVKLGNQTWNALGFNCYTSVDGVGTNNHNIVIPNKGGSAGFSNAYSVGRSYQNRTYTCHVGGDFSWATGTTHPPSNPVNATVTVPAGLHTVSYNANGGTGAPSNQTKEWGNVLTMSSTRPTRTGYTFRGWGTSASDTTPNYQPGGRYEADANITLYAIWTANNYTYNVRYVSSSGKSLGSTTVTHAFGGTYTVSAPAKTGYSTPPSQSIAWDSTSAKTITFRYSPVTYTISYVLDGGSVSGNPSSYNIESYAITLKNPTRTGFDFRGWSGTGISGSSMSVTIPTGSTGNRSYSAIWESKRYTISFNQNTSDTVTNMPSSQTKVHFQTLTLPNNVPIRKRYTFLGWATSPNSSATYQPGDSYTMEGNATLYAIWKLKASVVKVYQPDGTGRDGICSIYDDAGNHHYAILWVYDENGNRHEVL